ncbi:MAG: 50S ribosomal protein L25/general stress protein Ctc [Proteobacteria bacterium]|nr:50S ribosomal protein L25/general stress protein Ctc [Pseudomonadota bacterium]
MADAFELNAELRTDKGKGASRRLRRIADLVPGILYGGDKEPLMLSIAHKDLHKACENEAFFSHIITIHAGGNSQEAILKDLQRHPAKDRIMHADFLRIQADQEITVEVPIHFLNEEKCLGVRQHNGMLSRNMNSVQITCLPRNLPEYIAVDVEHMDIGDAIHLSQLQLPEGTAIPELALGEEHDHVVVTINEQKRAEEDGADEAAAPADVPTVAEDEGDESSDDD